MSHSSDKSLTYTLVYQAKEYSFQIDRQGHGRCICRGDVLAHLKCEGNLALKYLLGDERARKRIDQLEGEFSIDVTLPDDLTHMLWHGWDTAGEATNETRAVEAEIDRLLGNLIEAMPTR